MRTFLLQVEQCGLYLSLVFTARIAWPAGHCRSDIGTLAGSFLRDHSVWPSSMSMTVRRLKKMNQGLFGSRVPPAVCGHRLPITLRSAPQMRPSPLRTLHLFPRLSTCRRRKGIPGWGLPSNACTSNCPPTKSMAAWCGPSLPFSRPTSANAQSRALMSEPPKPLPRT